MKTVHFPVSDQKNIDLYKKMEILEIYEEDLEESFIRGSGKGGQKINKTSVVVRLKHKISGIEVKCQESRSRELNRYYARKRLVEKIDDKINHEKSEKRKNIEKIKRQKRKRSKKAKEKVLQYKKLNAEKKNLRTKVKYDD